MSKAHSITFRGTVERYADAIRKLHSPGDYVFVVRGIPRTIVMSCPDDCGEILTVNLDGRSGPAWRKYERRGKLTIYPSIWKATGCRAHFIIWSNCILWCGLADDPQTPIIDETLISNILMYLPSNGFVHSESIAEALQATPWEAYWACKELERRGQAVEGKQKWTFRNAGEADTPPSGGRNIDVRA